MSVARYADYIGDLRVLFAELDRRSERFQTFDVRLELVAAGSLVVYETKRRKGQTDSLYYGRSAATGQNQQISQAAAFSAIDRFFALGQFAALTDQVATGKGAESRSVDAQYPHCAVNFSYRKKGQAVARSTLMVFVGFNDEADALDFTSIVEEPGAFVAQRPYHTAKSHEWK
ncbi:hypothetical protein LJR098_003520 [Rhizobium sp. LjRoot98]|uniref:hypothetical protein n=1 Tax=Rhizobium sp. LjRoot98 TaxID=3342345 RepID=UPI003ECC2BCB